MDKKETIKKDFSVSHARFLKNREWRNMSACKSILDRTLNDLSTKKEEELTKKDLVYLISCCCDYMRALNMYNYYKDTLSSLMADTNDGEQ